MNIFDQMAQSTEKNLQNLLGDLYRTPEQRAATRRTVEIDGVRYLVPAQTPTKSFGFNRVLADGNPGRSLSAGPKSKPGTLGAKVWALVQA